jgi:uncharacterized OB-fold protein
MRLHMSDEVTYPARVIGFYDRTMWEELGGGSFALHRCDACEAFRYPPAPICSECLSSVSTWTPVSGGGEIIARATFHRTYLPAYPAPHTVAAIRLDEGPIVISIVLDATLDQQEIGRRVRLKLVERAEDYVLPCFELA